MRFVPTLQLDPYYYTPLWPDTVSLAAMQAQAMIDAVKRLKLTLRRLWLTS